MGRSLFLLPSAFLVFVFQQVNAFPSIGYFALSYRVVGVDPDTQIPYQGFCRIEMDEEGGGSMVRVINGKIRVAHFAIEDGENHEGTPIKEIIATFVEGEEAYEIIYSFQNSIDNHPLLTGTIRRVGGRNSYAEGFEMLRPIATTMDLHKSIFEELQKVQAGILPREKGDPDRLQRLLEVIPKEEKPGDE